MLGGLLPLAATIEITFHGHFWHQNARNLNKKTGAQVTRVSYSALFIKQRTGEMLCRLWPGRANIAAVRHSV